VGWNDSADYVYYRAESDEEVAMKIKNINRTSQTTCACGSWLKHWEKFSGQSITYCPEINCMNKDLLGAHVQKAVSSDTNWYIFPLCGAHNKSTGVLDVSDTYILVSANKKETCEK
jgi:hypothetical protein